MLTWLINSYAELYRVGCAHPFRTGREQEQDQEDEILILLMLLISLPSRRVGTVHPTAYHKK